MKLLCLVTAGKGGQDALRARRLTANLNTDKNIEKTFFEVDKSLSKKVAMREVWNVLQSQKWDLVYQEGTGIAGGVNLIRAARRSKLKYIVSSGDPIGGFFRVTDGPLMGLLFEVYERLLYRYSAGFVGWTPYLTGAAIKMGAKRGVTVEGGVDLDVFKPCSAADRIAIRASYGIPENHLVCGVVGSLNWAKRQSYSYGLELVETLKLLKRNDITMMIVGDGDGKARMQALVPEDLRSRAIFTGRIPQTEVVRTMNAMDIGFITQTLDGLGSFRLTTKLPEYLACGLPVAMSPIPGFFDYVGPAGWPLPELHPAHADFHRECARWLDSLCADEIPAKSQFARPIAVDRFEYSALSKRFCTFVERLL